MVGGASSERPLSCPLAAFIWPMSSDPLAALCAAGTETDSYCREERVGAETFCQGTAETGNRVGNQVWNASLVCL